VKTSAVILAAGAGSRLGGVAKALLPARNGRTFLGQIVATLREVGVEHPIVVVGPPFAAAVGSAADELGAAVVVNPEPARGMASSVAIGFAALAQLVAPARTTGGPDEAVTAGADVRGVVGSFADVEAAWLWPVDHPDIAADTLQRLISTLMNHDAARPVYAQRGGHPPLIARSLFAPLADCAGLDGGARSVLAAADTIDVPVDDPGCVRDIDTASDLEAR
jgi:CTP:molybdopterin cytidylyltransferase MocA